MRISILIRSLDTGGAERQVVETAIALSRLGHDLEVVIVYRSGELILQLEDFGIPVKALHRRGRWEILGFFFRYILYLRKQRPNVVYSFLSAQNAVASLATLFANDIKLVWGVRNSAVPYQYDFLARLSFLLERSLAKLPSLILANSNNAAKRFCEFVDDVSRVHFLPNGIDLTKFQPNRQLGKIQRSTWGIRDGEILIGIIARLDVRKDHATFLRSAKIVLSEISSARFVVIGDGLPDYKQRLIQLTSELGLIDKVFWAGEISDMCRAYNALDLVVQSSYTEGFPNVLAEAMACGVDCVATDVGESAAIIADPSRIVIPSQPVQLANAIIQRVGNPRPGETLSELIRARYSTHSLACKLEKLFLTL